MARTPKLSDLQLILLATAAQRDDGSLMPPPESLGDQGDRIRKAIPPLIKRALAEEIEVTQPDRTWREEGDRRLGLIITTAGRAIIAAQEAEPPAPADVDTPSAPAAEEWPITPSVETNTAEPQKTGSKISQVIALLGRDEGATLAEMVAATGWLPHTTRAALTGLRKKNHAIVRNKRGEETCYRIEVAA